LVVGPIKGFQAARRGVFVIRALVSPRLSFGRLHQHEIMNYPAASSGVSKSQRLGESQAQQAAGNKPRRDFNELEKEGFFKELYK